MVKSTKTGGSKFCGVGHDAHSKNCCDGEWEASVFILFVAFIFFIIFFYCYRKGGVWGEGGGEIPWFVKYFLVRGQG